MNTVPILRFTRPSLLALPLVLGLIGSTPRATAAVLLTDVVDSGGGWNTITGGTFSASAGGLTPQAGTSFFNGSNSSSTATNRGISKYFSSYNLAAGTYTATFSLGDLNTLPFTTSAFEIKLMADTNNDGNYTYSERINSGITAVSKVNPADAWNTWTYSYTITDSTTTAAGNLAVGSHIGFMILANVASSNYAFDNLTIDYVPEPATNALLGAGVILSGFVLRKRRQRNRLSSSAT